SIWLSKWDQDGLNGIQDEAHSGRPPILDAEERERLKAIFAENPRQIRAAQAKLAEETGKTACTETLKRALKNLGYRYKRARLSLRQRRDEQEFRRSQGVVKGLQQWESRGEIELYYFDEAGLSQFPPLPSAWGPAGKMQELPAFSHSKRLNVLGFLSRRGQSLFHTTTAKVATE